jgi:hypothetical protein
VVQLLHLLQDPLAAFHVSSTQQVQDRAAALSDRLRHPVEVGGRLHVEIVGPGQAGSRDNRLGYAGLGEFLLRVMDEAGEVDVRMIRGHRSPTLPQ